jgi:hypothetical protein
MSETVLRVRGLRKEFGKGEALVRAVDSRWASCSRRFT